MKHTIGDVLEELNQLRDLYSDAFYNGDVNDHLMGYLEDLSSFEFWYDYISHRPQVAILEQVRESVPDAGSSL